MSSDSLKKKKDHLYFILIMCFLSILVTINITESLCSIFVVILRTERYTTDLSNSSRVAVSFTDLLSLFIFHRVLKCNETRKIFGLHTAKNLIWYPYWKQKMKQKSKDLRADSVVKASVIGKVNKTDTD